MKKIAFFCIPAHGHTNPMLPVASELSTPIIKAIQKKKYNSFVEKCGKKRKND